MTKPRGNVAQKLRKLGVSIRELAPALRRAKAVSAQGRFATASASGTSIRLPVQAGQLSTGEFVVAVADSSSLTVGRVRAPSIPSAEDPESSKETWARLAVRLAGIELAIGELARAGLIPGRGPVSALTESEERVLRRGGFDIAAPPPDMIDPVSRATAEFGKLVSDSYTTDQAAKILGVNSSRVRQRVAGTPRTLFGIKLGNEWRIPMFQFVGSNLVPGIDKVISELSPDLHPVSVYRWFTTPSPDLSHDHDSKKLLSPLDWLKVGNSPDPVAELASGL